MLTSVKIKNIRGIRQGELAEFTPLVVLVGPNGCGKSTILDALLIGSAAEVTASMSRCVERRNELPNGGRWLLHRRAAAEGAQVYVATSGGIRRSLTFKRVTLSAAEDYRLNLQYEGVSGAGDASISLRGGVSATVMISPFRGVPDVRLLYPGDRSARPLHTLFTEVVERGLRQSLFDMISRLLPGVQSVEILTEGDTPVLNLIYQQTAVPVAFAGDGVVRLVRMACEVAAEKGSVILVEEPETHLHPAAQREAAMVFRTAARQGVQVIMTTHSLEFIDALVEGATDQELEAMSLYRLALENGQLGSSRLDGKGIATARFDIASDLR